MAINNSRRSNKENGSLIRAYGSLDAVPVKKRKGRTGGRMFDTKPVVQGGTVSTEDIDMMFRNKSKRKLVDVIGIIRDNHDKILEAYPDVAFKVR